MQVAKQKIVVLGTGGTIAGESAHASERLVYTSAQRSIDQLLACLPNSPAALQAHELVSEQVAQLDSKDMDAVTLARLAQRVAELLDEEAVQGVARRDADARSATPLSPLCDPNPGIAAVACRFDLPAPDRADDRIARDEAR